MWSVFSFKVFDGADDCVLCSFEYLSSYNNLIEDSIDFMKIKDDVQLTDISEILVQILDKKMDQLDRVLCTSKWSN